MFKTSYNIIKALLKNNDNKKLLNNFLNLGSVQIIEMLLPLITVPYITRVIGFEKIGIIAFASAIIGYFGICINYGFNLTATKEVAQNKENQEYVNKLFLEVSFTKSFLILLSFIILLFLFFIPKFNEEYLVFLLLFASVMFQNLLPTWFLQGYQDLNFSTKVSVAGKIISTALIFILVNTRSDYWIIVLLQTIQSFITLLAVLFFIVNKYKIKFQLINFCSILKQLYYGKYVFLSQIKITFFNNFNILILGVILGDIAVGLFSSADKIIKIVSAAQIPIVSALYPYFSSLIKSDIRAGFNKINKFAIYGAIVYGIVIVILFIGAPYFCELLFGSEVEIISTLVRIMSFIPLFVYLNNLYGTQFLLNLNGDKKFLVNMLLAAVFNLIFIFPLTYYFNVVGTAISILLTEFVVLLLMYLSSKKMFLKFTI